ncbi:MAG: Rid family detoxifying hydrolase [Candidatus Marinimicrobia bacterium]|jgi:2-aminomuconate deaminase|nr:Rid family detoxifying hydrolase [Candidatus Neomarinimicrobiota bacterium]MDP6789916.1 Rid family detoxifying hydrolase [Candidatus Neomarinimicrobiota bacterium]MDP7072828.1 Rid family detoxifying hydrolase [Candidatus Neomarinimicrobiota bacterium]|tara:strand:+ start:173 stop:604 length:432 start_codon:yes stop_codon:yes gene_type:complete
MIKSIFSEKAPDPVGPYPHAKQVGNFLFVSGAGPRKKDFESIPGVELNPDGTIASYDFETQAHSVLSNIKTILEDAGTSMENVVDVTVFLTNMKDDFQTFNTVYKEYFKEDQPARTTVEVTALPTPIAIELKCIAVIKPEKGA